MRFWCSPITSCRRCESEIALTRLVPFGVRHARLRSMPWSTKRTTLAAISCQQRFFPACNGPGCVAQTVRHQRIAAVGTRAARNESGAPWANGYRESFNARFRDEPPNGEVFHCLRRARILIEKRRRHDDTKRCHSALGYRPPVPETVVATDQRPVLHRQANWSIQVGPIRVPHQHRGLRCRGWPR